MGRMEESRRWFRGDRDDERGRYDEGRGYEGRDERSDMGGRSLEQGRYRGESGRYYRDESPGGGYYAQENWRPGEGRSPQGDYGQRGEYASYGGGQSHGQYGGQVEGRRQFGGGFDQSGHFAGNYGQPGQYGQRGQEYEGRGQRIGEQLEQFGGAMAGRVRRMFRPPKGYKRSDDRIKEDVCDQLAMSSHIDPSEIEITVHDGEVTLAGTVPERAMKWSVEQLVDNVSGVKDIHNQLRVKREDSQSATSGGAGSQSTSLGSSASGTTANRSQARS